MDIGDILAPSHVILDHPAEDKSALLKDLATRVATSAGLPADLVVDEIQKRDKLGSTGIGKGIALPHARLAQIKRPFGLLARLNKPIPYDAIDGQPIDIAFILLLPLEQADQMNALAAIARVLRDDSITKRIRSATNRSELYRVLTDE